VSVPPEEKFEMTPDERFELAKQLRIATRNRRVSKALLKRAEQRQLNSIGFGAVGSVILIGLLMWGMFYVALAR
jgi:hypothetical protein